GVEAAPAGVDIREASVLIETSPDPVIVSECAGDPVFAKPHVRAKDEAPGAELLVRSVAGAVTLKVCEHRVGAGPHVPYLLGGCWRRGDFFALLAILAVTTLVLAVNLS